MNLVNEQDIALFQICQQRGQIAGLGNHRAGRCPEPNPQFTRDNLRQRGLAQSRRAKEQHMIHRLAARLGALNEHPQVVLRRRLPDEFGERLGPQRGVGVVRLALRGEVGVIGHGRTKKSLLLAAYPSSNSWTPACVSLLAPAKFSAALTRFQLTDRGGLSASNRA